MPATLREFLARSEPPKPTLDEIYVESYQAAISVGDSEARARAYAERCRDVEQDWRESRQHSQS